MEKVDLKKQLKHLYGTTTAAGDVFVDVPAMQFLMIDGEGNPNTAQSYKQAVEALFSVSYTLKFMVKRGDLAIDYGVMPLEGLWWTDDMADFSPDNKDIWRWTAMVVQPEWVTRALVDSAIAAASKKKNLPALPALRLETWAEGKSAQCLHIGPYANEAPTIRRLHAFISDSGFHLRGKHHEIYLSDMRRTDPSKLKTIIRQPCS